MGGQNDRARRKAAKQARREKRKTVQQQGRSAVEDAVYRRFGITVSVLERAPLLKALVEDELFERGMGYAVISRSLQDGRIAAGVFLLDTYCLGVKNAFLAVTGPDQFADMFEKGRKGYMLNEQPAASVRKLVGDAVVYARSFGIEPHRDYREAALIFGDIDPAGCTESFVFGKDGKPLFIAGPRDTPERIAWIMRRLKAACGEGGYHYLMEADKYPDESAFAGDDGEEELM